MPIMVNMPGNGLDTAGQGVAAAQAYQANEQKMRLQEQDFKLQEQGVKDEIALATRKLDIEEANIDFGREQLAQQQEAAADYITAEMMKLGSNVSPEQKRALRMLSPDAQDRVLYGLAQQGRMRAQQNALDGAVAKLDELDAAGNVSGKVAELRAQAESGAITPQQFVSGVAALAKESATIDHKAKAYEVIQGQMDAWVDPKTNPEYDMPTEDDEAYDDVMNLMTVLSPNAPFDPKVDYGQAWQQYKFLTTRGMRDASRAMLTAEMKKNGVTTIDEGYLDELLDAASKDPAFRGRAADIYGQARSFTERVAGPLFKRSRPGAVEQSAPAPEGAVDVGAATPSPGGGEGRDLGAISKSLIPEADRLKPEEEALGNRAMENLGISEVPPEGSRLYLAFVREVNRLEKEAAETNEYGVRPQMDADAIKAAVRSTRKSPLDTLKEGAAFIGRKIVESAPKEPERRKNMAKTRRNRGVR